MKPLRKVALILGPTGVGKTTISNVLAESNHHFLRIISSTSRRPRCGEVCGVDYHFKDKDTVVKEINDKEIIGHTTYHDHLYGINHSDIHEAWDSGKIPLVILDNQGLKSLRETFDQISILIKPPSLEELTVRMLAQGIDKETVSQRIALAHGEISKNERFVDYVIVNDLLSSAVNQMKSILMSHCFE
jgi:guanylate kinase